jgi:hypothetical protein
MYRYFTGGCEGITKDLRILGIRPKFEPVTTSIPVRSDTALANFFDLILDK